MSEAAASAAARHAHARLARLTLAAFTLLNFANYVDRYVLPPVLEKIKADPAFAGVTDAGLGQLQTAFFVVYMLLSPVAGIAGRRVSRKYLVALGVGLWSLATVLSGLARNYNELLAARALIGAGEGGYATLAPAILSDWIAPGRRSRALAIFYVATPVGSALGVILGGFVGQHWSWRAAFFVAGGPGLLLALLVLLLPEPRRGAMDTIPGVTLAATSVLDELKALLRNRRYLRVTAASTLIAFAIGGLAFWMPSYFQAAHGRDAGSAGLIVGLSAVVAGLAGTLAGGWLGDAWLRRDPHALWRLSGTAVVLGIPLLVAVPFAPGLGSAVALLAGAELFFFLNTGPLNTALVESVPASFREGAIGLHIFIIHALGDAVSPALIGALAGALAPSFGRGQALGLAAAACAIPLAACALVLLAGLPRRRPRAAA